MLLWASARCQESQSFAERLAYSYLVADADLPLELLRGLENQDDRGPEAEAAHVVAGLQADAARVQFRGDVPAAVDGNVPHPVSLQPAVEVEVDVAYVRGGHGHQVHLPEQPLPGEHHPLVHGEDVAEPLEEVGVEGEELPAEVAPLGDLDLAGRVDAVVVPRAQVQHHVVDGGGRARRLDGIDPEERGHRVRRPLHLLNPCIWGSNDT
mmetsp:Transcript_68961/g.194479  ORF Transcript_68961/g.194479 Transcript_68961/m.194479 type:complete len:209 (+) Transcript_68961:71-697(+)